MRENIYTKIFKQMIKKILPCICIIFFTQCDSFSAVVKQQVNFSTNNISTWVWNTGVFNQDLRTNNTPGFQWPKGSNKFALFTSGLSIGAFVNGYLRMANASYNGEYCPGYVLDSAGIPKLKTNSRFKLYSVRLNDSRYTNPDYLNWKYMIPYGAPFEDVNNNKIYDDGIDRPGMPDAVQTIFMCYTDADSSNHTTSEGFSGGTDPLFAEIHMTAWGYDYETVSNVQFFKFDVINKNILPWEKTYFSFVSDPDLGEATDDYIGCDSILQMSYCYNATNQDGSGSGRTYGANPPAVGQMFLRPAILRSNNTIDTLKMKSSCYFTGTGSAGIACEQDPSSAPSQAYNYMRGIKKDGSPWLVPTIFPYPVTKLCFSGDPESAQGWSEYQGRINNCGGTNGPLNPSPPGDRRFILSSGSDLLNVAPGDTQKIVMAQLIERGTSNVNSVTKLKSSASFIHRFYIQAVEGQETYYSNLNIPAIPTKYVLHQNYPNPFNPVTTIKYETKMLWKVKIQVYDMRGELIKTLVNEEKPQGVYEVQFEATNLPSGIYFIKMVSGGGFEDSKKIVVIK